MSSKCWLDSYKPSLSNGIYGAYTYTDPIKFYPKQMEHYLSEKNNEYYVRNKFQKTLEHIDFDIDEWYKYVTQFTFDTKFIPIHPKYAQSILLFYRYRYCNAKISTVNMDVVNNLRELHHTLDQEIKLSINQWYNDHDNDEDKGVFIRFSNRSPKDGHKVYQTDPNDEKAESKEEKKESKDIDDPNIEFIDFCRKSAKDLFVNNGNDAMALILSSERVFSDLLAVLNAHKYPYKYLFYNQFTSKTMYENNEIEEKKSEFEEDEADELKWNEEKWEICNVSIAIRKWDNRIRDDLEWRCFVYDRKLRAISQYNHYCYFAELGDNLLFVENIKNKITNYFQENIQQQVPYSSYVIDIGVIILDEKNKENEDGLDCIVIELNPFKTSTGAGLFNWGKDEKQLKYGKEIEIRVHHKTVVSKDFVNHYLNDFNKYAVETPWYKLVDKMEREIIDYNNQQDNQNTNKRHCFIL